ncbi:MAG: hypothetical protein DRG66_05080 [Deltaproteobacteria bacterium]|jgi:hypothetical protein|nr:MAG: hypothetical protein DRG66_05080 [Deltaproteobacteria bacterium]
MKERIVIKIVDNDLHTHLKARMEQRGITRAEIERTLNEGWKAKDAKSGTIGKVFIFPYNRTWQGDLFQEKEVTVYYKVIKEDIVLLTVKARYGKHFRKEG